MGDFKTSWRMLPHWELEGATYFITFNTWERFCLTPSARQIVLEACLHFKEQRYRLWALVIMPDHVHLLLQPMQKPSGEFWSLRSILHSIKSYSAKQIPSVMTHLGTVWQPERFDRLIRNEKELRNTYEYIRQNPVKAKLSNSPQQYPFLWDPPLVG